jgi:hypothetical protein
VYKDFGAVGVVLAFGMIGALSTYFYLKGLSGDRLHIFCYGLGLFPLLFMTFSDQYFAPMLTWIMFGFAGYLYFRKNRGPGRNFKSMQTQGEAKAAQLPVAHHGSVELGRSV